MSLTLEFHGMTTIPVEVEGLTPEWAADRSLAEIEQFEIFHGNQRLPLAELFKVTGDPSDRQIEFVGNLSTVHWIGAKMACGRIHVRGSSGRHLGSEMSGGEILVDGNSGIFAGAEMRGGNIHIKGNADHLAGGAYRGSSKGMTGGTILIHGNAGNEAGLSMRRGLLAIGGTVGNVVGYNMIAGTIMVFGKCGLRPGAGMRRGTIALFAKEAPILLPSFQFASSFRPQFMGLMLRTLSDAGFDVDKSHFEADFDLFHGDQISLGRGEILFRRWSSES